MRVGFRVDASENIGSGHLFRCIKIANFLFKKNAKVYFLTNGLSKKFYKFIPQKFILFKIPFNFNQIERKILKNHFKPWKDNMISKDIDYLSKKITRKLDWLIIDHYGLDYRYQKKSYNFTKNVMVIDDLNKKNFCDVYLNYQPYYKSFFRNNFFLKKETNKLVGLRYNISDYSYEYVIKNKPKKNIYLSMGAVDKNKKLYQLIKKLSFFNKSKFNFYVYSPPTIKNFNLILNFCRNAKNIKIFKNPINLKKFYPKIDFVVSSISSTLYEQLKYGFKPLAIYQNPYQKKILKLLLKKKIINYIKLDKYFFTKLNNLLLEKKNYYLKKKTYNKYFRTNCLKEFYKIILKKRITSDNNL